MSVLKRVNIFSFLTILHRQNDVILVRHGTIAFNITKFHYTRLQFVMLLSHSHVACIIGYGSVAQNVYNINNFNQTAVCIVGYCPYTVFMIHLRRDSIFLKHKPYFFYNVLHQFSLYSLDVKSES